MVISFAKYAILAAFGSSLPHTPLRVGAGVRPSCDYHWTLTGPDHPSGGPYGAHRPVFFRTNDKFNIGKKYLCMRQNKAVLPTAMSISKLISKMSGVQ